MFKKYVLISLFLLVLIFGSTISFAKSRDDYGDQDRMKNEEYESVRSKVVKLINEQFLQKQIDMIVIKDPSSSFHRSVWYDVGCSSGTAYEGNLCAVGQLRQIYAECLNNDHCGGSEPYCKLSGCNDYSCVECQSGADCESNEYCNHCGTCAVAGGGGGVPCIPWPEGPCNVPLSPKKGDSYVKHMIDQYFFTANSLSESLFYSTLKEVKYNLDRDLTNKSPRASYQCVASDSCATCADLLDNDYSSTQDCESAGCGYDDCDNSRYDFDRHDRDRMQCSNFFGESGQVAVLNGVCEGQTPIGGIVLSGDLPCNPHEGYVRISNAHPDYATYFSGGNIPSLENLNYNFCGNLYTDCCVDINQPDWSEDGSLGDQIFYNYCGDNYCQGWLDSSDNTVCRGPFHDNPSGDCYADSSWNLCEDSPELCSWDGGIADIRETPESCSWIDHASNVYSDCRTGCIQYDEHGFATSFECDSAIQSDCTILNAESCPDGSNKVQGLTISSATNGHLSEEGYDWIVCCDPNLYTVSTSGTYEMLSLSGDSTNSHFGVFGTTDYINYYIEGSGISSGCQIVDHDACNNEDDFCFVSISGEDNAHVADCIQEGYSYKLCCS